MQKNEERLGMIREPDIELIHSELLLLQKICFDPINHDEYHDSREPMEELSTSLLDRGAIPEVRLLYFTDPQCNPGGRGKSRQSLFEGNGTVGDEILRHPNFLKFLEYFVFGPNLPRETIIAFKEAAQYTGHLSHSDMHDLLPAAKELVKSNRMDSSRAAEEFHKLALECGAIPSTAESLRDSIRKIRVAR